MLYKCLIHVLKIVYIHLYNIFVSLLLKCGLDLSRRRYFISENMATCSLIATGLIFYDLRRLHFLSFQNAWMVQEVEILPYGRQGSGGRFKNTYELLKLRALKSSPVNKIHIFQCMGKIFCVEFQRYPLKFHTKYLTHTLKDMIFIQRWHFKSS